MFLSKIRVKNYKSFRDSGEIEFKSGINLVVGQNNSGKTALLEALSLSFESKPHKNLKNVTRSRLWQNPNEEENQKKHESSVEVSVIVPPEEIFELEGETIWLPYLIKREKINGQLHQIGCQIFDYRNRLKRPLEIRFKHDGLNVDNKSVKDDFAEKINIQNFAGAEGAPTSIIIKENGIIEFGERGDTSKMPFSYQCSRTFSSNVYKFKAERICKSGCIVGTNRELDTNGANLAEVLLNTHTNNNEIYKDLIKHVSEVIPSVKWVSSVRTESKDGQGPFHEIRIWTSDKTREELAIPLSECGTGVGQVLAILYVVVASEHPRTIIIDEPNSFLHPGASKKLIQILNKFPQHQYFISTHSPEIMTAAKPSTITRLNYIDSETKVESLDLSDKSGLKDTFKELGIKQSDFFFSDSILWVEGETEEKAFPLVLKNLDIENVTVLSVMPSEIRNKKSARKNTKNIFKIYKQLSGTDALTPSNIIIVLDREDYSENDIRDDKKELGDSLHFIPRRMFENYFLDAEAITSVYNETAIEDAPKVTIEQVIKWIEENKSNPKYVSKVSKDKEDPSLNDWVKDINSAKLLNDLFTQLSNSTNPFQKTTHSVMLTRWTLENKPDQLSELKEFLLEILGDQN